MRQTINKGKRRKKSNGCSLGCIRFLIFLIFIIIVAYFAGKAYFGSDVATKIRKTQYPIKYEYFVEKYSNEFKLEKSLVYAVIRTESRFDKYAVSKAYAKGLMQLTDETGEDCARKLKVSKYSNDALFDPEINIRLGCFYLRQLINKYGNINTALAAYNGGPGNVDKWLLDPACVNDNGELVNIPFNETANYVVRVNNATEMYKKLYENKE